jgi:BTB/POZ domain-containing protein KCTD9
MVTKKSLWQKLMHVFNSITEKQILSTTLVMLFVGIFVISLSFPHYNNPDHHFYENLLVEAHGMIFDLLIIGILLVWLNKMGEKRLRIRRYQEEIDDFRHWINDEASFRIAGDLKRLNKDKVYNIDLYNCHLKNVNLNYVTLSGSNMNYINLEDSTLQNANLDNVRLNQANLQNVKMQGASLKNAQMSGANLQFTTAIKTDFTDANLIKAKFKGAVLIDSILTNSMVAGADFTDANLFKADLSNAKGLTAEQLSTARSVHMAVMAPEIEAKLRDIAPQLFNISDKKAPSRG